jgi:hypothetical protein
LVTAVVTAIPHFRFATAQPELQGACEAAAAVIAVLAAILAAARLRRRCSRTDLALASALAVIALSNLFFDTVPDLAGLSASSVAVWSAIMGRSLGSVLFGVAAYVPARSLRRPGRAQALALAALPASWPGFSSAPGHWRRGCRASSPWRLPRVRGCGRSCTPPPR